MGWLEDLAKASGHRSLRALSVAMEDSDAWPEDDARKRTTVENNLRHLDALENPDWWLGTGEAFLPALAAALHESLEDVRRQIEQELLCAEGRSDRVWTFDLFPELGPLDLIREPLFPGIPHAIRREGGPRQDRVWWVAPSGAGKTLVGRWLRQNHGWTVLKARDWSSALSQLPDTGPVFLELEQAGEAQVVPQERLNGRLCVACPQPPPDRCRQDRRRSIFSGGQRWPQAGDVVVGASDRAAAFHVLETGSVRDWHEDLIDWVDHRIRAGGGFDAEAVRTFVREHPEMVRRFSTPGEFLGWLSTVEQAGLPDEDDDFFRAVRAYIAASTGRTDRPPGPGIAKHLRRQGHEDLHHALVEMLRQGLELPLPESVWVDLLPQQPQIDAGAVLNALDHEDPMQAIAKARALVQVDRETMVEALRTIGILEESGEGLYVEPSWLLEVVLHRAMTSLLDEGPRGMGLLALHPYTVADIVQAVFEAILDGDFDVLREMGANEVDTPEEAAAVDATIRGLGLGLLHGAEVPAELVEGVWKRQASLLVRAYRDDPLVPMVSVTQLDWGHEPTRLGLWHLSMFAIARELEDPTACGVPACFDVWREHDADDGVLKQRERVLSGLLTVSDRELVGPIAQAAYLLGNALLDARGVFACGHGPVADIQVPDLVVRLAGGDHAPDVTEEQRHVALQLRCGTPALVAACERHGTQLDDVLAWCWHHWTRPGALASGNAASRWPPFWVGSGTWNTEEGRRTCWQALPLAAVNEPLAELLKQRSDLWPFLSEDAWLRCLDLWAAKPDKAPLSFRGRPDDAVQIAPPALGIEALRRGLLKPADGEAIRSLWARDSRRMLQLVDDWAPIETDIDDEHPRSSATLVDVVFSTAPGVVPALLDRATAWLDEPSAYPRTRSWVERWLRRVVHERHEGWRQAFRLLMEHREALVPKRGIQDPVGKDGE